MTKAEERALEAYNDMFHNPEKMSVRSTISPEEVAESNFDYKEPFKAFFLDVYQQGYERAEKDILSKITPEHIAGLKWIGNAGISSQPYPYHKYCKDLLKILEELLNNE